MKRRAIIGGFVIGLLAGAAVGWQYRGRVHAWAVVAMNRTHTLEDRLEQYGEAARARMRPHFERAGVAYPPRRLVLLGLKEERRLGVYAAPKDEGPPRLVRQYIVQGASGGPGPKLRRGDRQVPEGLYAIESLNPNSRFHLSLRVNYPSDDDREMARRDGREDEDLGSDIMIHGGSSSVGCLAMGDPVAEELFVLAADVGVGNIDVTIAPRDLRLHDAPEVPGAPAWLAERYGKVKQAMEALER